MSDDGTRNRSGPANLWAPWRFQYISDTSKNEGCIFCETCQSADDEKNLIVHRGSNTFIIMNKFPYNNGHLLIVPCQHTAEMTDLNDAARLEVFEFMSLSQKVLNDVMHPQGFNFGMNLGRLAGAGITDHLHIHVVPRWGGDTNFMPIVGHTKVISEALEKTWEKLNSAFKKISI